MGLQQTPTQVIILYHLSYTFYYGTLCKNLGKMPLFHIYGWKMGYEEALKRGLNPFKEFMIKNTRESDLALFYRIKRTKTQNIDDVPLTLLMPAFIVSELRTAFEIGF